MTVSLEDLLPAMSPHVHDDAPSPWVRRFAHLVPEGARVLDLACGGGRHARFFAGRGAHVLAIDRDRGLLARLAGVAHIETRCADLETGAWPLADRRFDAIVVVNYLHRPLFPFLRAALAPAGALIYETFAQGNERFGRPANPDFLLRRDELREVFAPSMHVVAFEQGEVRAAERAAVVQRLAAVDSSRAWPPLLSEATPGAR